MKHSNRLASEKSPYLLQHAGNPVDWHPWGDEAFRRAADENKPVFLSIGYSTCHWCHVMAHESFEDPEIARLMNDAFISIKVDREERPDIDALYMNVCQLLTGSGGWPLTVFLTPDRKPFYAGTYFPKQSRFGRIGMLDLVPKIKELWAGRRDDLVRSADRIIDGLQSLAENWRGGKLDENALEAAYGELAERFDDGYGGFGFAPKFPTPHNLLFLLRRWKRTGEAAALQMVEKTLESMRRGGIYDQIGFGFHRYSVDREWFVPHFEKMLYDQALLAMAYTEAYQTTGKKQYEKTAREIFAYVLRDLKDRAGAFYASEDADSEGVEGKFYLWSEAELEKLLSPEEYEFARKFFGVEPGGNFLEEATGEKTGSSILSAAQAPEEQEARLLETVRKKLFDARSKRIRPHLDDKILTDWNGLMIAALAKGAAAFGAPEYAEAAERASRFISERLRGANGNLLHRYRDGEAAIAATANDYAFLTWGLIELHQATFKPEYLAEALKLTGELVKRFRDREGGGFFLTPDDGEPALIRLKEIYDGAIPSSNSAAMLNLLRLSRLTGDAELEEKSAEMASAFSNQIMQTPSAFSLFMCALDFAIGPAQEVVVAGDPSQKPLAGMITALRKDFLPNAVLLSKTAANAGELARLAPFTKELKVEKEAVIYVCSGGACRLPAKSAEDALRALAESGVTRGTSS